MLDEPKIVIHDKYDGSRMFTWLADLCGLSVDLTNFLICQFSALFLASLFRSILHHSKVSSEIRHICALTLGLTFGYFCFGQEAIHIAALPAICYVVIRTQNPAVVQKIVFIVAMLYLLSVHLIRTIYDYGSYSLDITGPLMIITQKVISVAFNIHDGFISERNNAQTSRNILTKTQYYYAIKKPPTPLEYFSYVFHFQSVMVGPLVFYKDYIEFIDGTSILTNSTTNNNLDNGNTRIVIEPSPTKVVIKKVIASLICGTIFMKFTKIYPIKHMKDNEFIENETIIYKFWYIMMSTTAVRFKYYHAWLLADAICNNSGLGFAGYDKERNPKWDLITNIYILQFEFATNMREAINNWNIGTNRWLRFIVYERISHSYGTILTFGLSAIWHGFHAGYYVTFATGALMVTAARVARNLFRHRFQTTQFTRMLYDITTCAITRIFMGYTTFPFVVLEFVVSARLYLKLYMCLHLIALFTIYVLPRFIQIEKRQKMEKNQLKTSSSDTSSLGKDDKMKTSSCSSLSISLNNDTFNDKKNKNDLNNFNCKFINDNKLNGNDCNQKNLVQKSQWQININDQDNIKNVKQNITTTTTTTIKSCEKITQENQKTSTISTNNARDAISVKHDQCEMDNLSNKIKEKIDIETKHIENFIDKTVNETVSGIVEFKNDLMRDSDKLFISQDGILRKRNSSLPATDSVDAFIKKEIGAINAAVQQANVLPAVLSNGHAK